MKTSICCNICRKEMRVDEMIEAPVGFICSSCSEHGESSYEKKDKDFEPRFKFKKTFVKTNYHQSLVVVPLLITTYIICYYIFNIQLKDVVNLAITSKNIYYSLPGDPLFKSTRFVISGFLHANFPHILSNIISLLIIGPLIERQCGRKNFLAIYTSGLLLGSISTFFLTSNTSSVGASGAIVALFGFYAFMIYRLTGNKFTIIFFLFFMLAQSLFQANVNIYAHLIGFFIGAVYGLYPKFYAKGWVFNTFLFLFILFISYVQV